MAETVAKFTTEHGKVIMDIRSQTVSKAYLAQNTSATDSTGQIINGTFDTEALGKIISGTIQHFKDDELITKLGTSVFADCTQLESVDCVQIKEIGDKCFWGCISFGPTANFPNAKKVGDRAFSECSSLERVILAADVIFDQDGLQFNGCTNLKHVGTAESIGIHLEKETEIPKQMFNHCSSIEFVYLNETTTIHSGAFNSCTSLKEVVAPKLKVLESNTMSPFEHCINLETITGVLDARTNENEKFGSDSPLQYIGDGTFLNCDKFVDRYLANVEYIGDSALSGCDKLDYVYPIWTTNSLYYNHNYFWKLKELGQYAFSDSKNLGKFEIGKCSCEGETTIYPKAREIFFPVIDRIEDNAFDGVFN